MRPGPSSGEALRALLDAVMPRAHHRLASTEPTDPGAGRLARRLIGRALGVVLSGGGARGFAHIGALAELEHGVMLRRLWAQQLDLVDGLIALAAVTAAVGDRARAGELYDEAETILAVCPDPGALPRRLAAARLTAEPAAATQTELSERELTVLRLLSGGGSEREIARRFVRALGADR